MDSFIEIIGKIFLVIWKIIKWIFATSWFLTVLMFALLDLWLGDGSWWRSLTASNTRNKTNNLPKPEEISSSTTNEILEKYGEDLHNYAKSKPATSVASKILEKIRKNPHCKLDEILSEEEMTILFEMVVKALGFEII